MINGHSLDNDNVSTLAQGDVLQINHLTRVFKTGDLIHPKSKIAVNDVSFRISKGSATAIVGESGSGKSTILNILAGLLPPTTGDITINQQHLRAGARISRRYRQQVQLVFQDPFSALNPHFTVHQLLDRPLRNFGMGNASTRYQRINEVLSLVGLTPELQYLTKYPHELSGGQRQRIVIARAVEVNPELLLADEPTSMLDMSIRIAILDILKDLQRENGLAILLVTHDLLAAQHLTDNTLVMYFGRLVEGGPSHDMIRNPQHPYTQLLLAAVPDPTSRDKWRNLPERTGLLDSPSETGCPFATRCPYVMDACYKTFPPRTWVTNDHWVSCHWCQRTKDSFVSETTLDSDSGAHSQ